MTMQDSNSIGNQSEANTRLEEILVIEVKLDSILGSNLSSSMQK
jgi:hypothetical protein